MSPLNSFLCCCEHLCSSFATNASVLLICVVLTSQAEAEPFRNLDFDEGSTNNVPLVPGPSGPTGYGPISELLPGWSLLLGNEPVTNIGVNLWPFEPSQANLFSADGPGGLNSYVAGRFALRFEGVTGKPFSLIQDGKVPVNSQVLTMDSLWTAVNTQASGQALPLVSWFPYYNRDRPTGIYHSAYDISAFSGHDVELRLVDGGFLDSIQFKPSLGITRWMQRSSIPASQDLFGIAYGNGVFKAVGDGGTILSSTNGSTWVREDSGTLDLLSAVAAGPGLWAAVGVSGTILSASDGQHWTVRQTDPSGHLVGIIYAQGLFVAVGGHGINDHQSAWIWTSPDGVIWTDRSPQNYPGMFFPELSDVVYVPEFQSFVAMGMDTVMVSNSGVVWNVLGPPPAKAPPEWGGGKNRIWKWHVRFCGKSVRLHLDQRAGLGGGPLCS